MKNPPPTQEILSYRTQKHSTSRLIKNDSWLTFGFTDFSYQDISSKSFFVIFFDKYANLTQKILGKSNTIGVTSSLLTFPLRNVRHDLSSNLNCTHTIHEITVDEVTIGYKNTLETTETLKTIVTIVT